MASADKPVSSDAAHRRLVFLLVVDYVDCHVSNRTRLRHYITWLDISMRILILNLYGSESR
jgi:hypothetical protein